MNSKRLAKAIAAIAESGADALIVQDVGIMQLAHEIAPDLELHASTQMSITNADGSSFRAAAWRVSASRSHANCRSKRFARSASRPIATSRSSSMARCASPTPASASRQKPGAGAALIAVNAPRLAGLPYELIVDDELRPLDDARYLLSPGDLYALHHVPEMVEIGISALKIEGRYKDADYVALATRAYRKAVDDAWAGLRAADHAQRKSCNSSRCIREDWARTSFRGTNHQTRGRRPGAPPSRRADRPRDKVVSDAAVIEPPRRIQIAPFKPGDGIVFDAAAWTQSDRKPRRAAAYTRCRTAARRDADRAVRQSGSRLCARPSGDLVWRTHDPDLDKAVRPYPRRGHSDSQSSRFACGRRRAGRTAAANALVIGERRRPGRRKLRGSPLGLRTNRELDARLLARSALASRNYALTPSPRFERGHRRISIRPGLDAEPDAARSCRKIAGASDQSAPLTCQISESQLEAWQGAAASRARPDSRSLATSLHLLVRTPEQLEAAHRSTTGEHYARLPRPLRLKAVGRAGESIGNHCHG